MTMGLAATLQRGEVRSFVGGGGCFRALGRGTKFQKHAKNIQKYGFGDFFGPIEASRSI